MSHLLDTLGDHLPQLAQALLVTAVLVAISFAAAVVTGTIVCSARLAPARPLRALGALYVETFRNVPLLVLIFATYLGLRHAGLPISAWAAGVASLSLYSGAYIAEALRAGVLAIDRGQLEAAQALGFRPTGAWRTVVLPQATRTVIAPLGNLLIGMVKNSAVVGASILGIPELMNQARIIQSDTFRTTETFFWAAIGYLLLTLAATWAVARAEQRFAIRR